MKEIEGKLAFLEAAESLKSVLRSGFISSGRAESTAEHTWRLCLMAMVFEDELADLNMLKVLKMCIVHDLGEAIHGDVPAIQKDQYPDKSAQEKADMLQLTQSLLPALRDSLMALWQEYEDGVSPEAKAVKALDKLETILQHTQGQNPPDFDYAFNLQYGQKYTETTTFFAAVRRLLDQKTQQRIAQDT
jgi:putative hydrolase of HD superfamily